ncbi:uncharacterized protein BJ171DRAFT_475620 [Polychytrium aggregatum]|uniref:uncharacterized protein n=1 Tax=Polychytrium aggregatum TaxID=110093 RepID=UPI0022FE7716|nr:uncharacterized protein BJ171DRAFT_475620 [Polychytrium aggregatum]KAI9203583.1 hypothetical protein BJ171DRAFT_475620 [Polychytrium aggregatum]
MTASACPYLFTKPLLDKLSPDIFTIVCCNDSFQLALDHSTIKTLLRVCKRAQPLLSSKVPRFYTWCQSMELLNPDGQMRIGLTPSDLIAISLHWDQQATADRSWLEDQADQGNIDSQTDDDDEPEENTNHQQVFSLLEATANARHTMVHFHLAECYSKGVGVDQDHTKAVELYRSLADHGIPQAQVALGRCYENGDGVDQDYETAIEWYSKAPDQGSEDGRLHIVFLRGWFSFIGHGVKQSDADAFNHWHEVSNLSADPIIKSIATHMVGWMHYLGRGTVRDEQKGVKIIRDNQSDGFKLGEDECLAGFLNDILSDSPAPRKFFNLCQLGSDRDWLCEHLMGVCMANGFGTTKDRKKAAAIFEQLAADGHSDSQYWIGPSHSPSPSVNLPSIDIACPETLQCQERYGLERNRQCLLDNEYDTIDSVCASDMRMWLAMR